jgi:hypothetical protein
MNSPATILSEVTEIFPGYTIRPQKKERNDFDCAIIGMSNVNIEDCTIQIGEPETRSEQIPHKHLLRSGDVLLLAKGNRNHAIVYRGHEKAIASNVFLIIRVKSNVLDPDYLSILFNHGELKHQLEKIKVGTSITNINKSELEAVTFSLPALITQKTLVSLYRSLNAEKQETLRLLSLKELLFKSLLTMKPSDIKIPKPFSDDIGLWRSFEHACLYYIARMQFNDPIFIKGFPKPVNEVFAIITQAETKPRTEPHPSGDGSMITYNAIDQWHFFVFSKLNLDKWNGQTTPRLSHEEATAEIINVVPHGLIDNITIVDRQGNQVQANYPTNSSELSKHDRNFY